MSEAEPLWSELPEDDCIISHTGSDDEDDEEQLPVLCLFFLSDNINGLFLLPVCLRCKTDCNHGNQVLVRRVIGSALNELTGSVSDPVWRK